MSRRRRAGLVFVVFSVKRCDSFGECRPLLEQVTVRRGADMRTNTRVERTAVYSVVSGSIERTAVSSVVSGSIERTAVSSVVSGSRN